MSISLLQGKNINWLIKMGKSQTLLTFEIPTQEHPPPHPPSFCHQYPWPYSSLVNINMIQNRKSSQTRMAPCAPALHHKRLSDKFWRLILDGNPAFTKAIHT